jgi:hypothetical protein
VNALSTRPGDSFQSRMTVLFGENGTGKTGYVHLLKRIASVRTSEPICPTFTTSFNASYAGGLSTLRRRRYVDHPTNDSRSARNYPQQIESNGQGRQVRSSWTVHSSGGVHGR